jgi:hypothetical protein
MKPCVPVLGGTRENLHNCNSLPMKAIIEQLYSRLPINRI